MVELMIVTIPAFEVVVPLLRMPPPLTAKLLLMVELMIVTLAPKSLKIPPPSTEILELLLIVELIIVAMPTL